MHITDHNIIKEIIFLFHARLLRLLVPGPYSLSVPPSCTIRQGPAARVLPHALPQQQGRLDVPGAMSCRTS